MKIKISQKRLDKGLYWERAWTLVNGCTKVSEGCENCWSALMDYKFNPNRDFTVDSPYLKEQGQWTGKIRLCEDNLDLPLKVKKPTVWAVWNDLFHEKVPFEFVEKVFGIMAAVRYHTFLVLTKRPERMLNYCKWQTGLTGEGYLNEGNVWIGVTAENQRTVDERIPILLQIPAAIRFVSVEPCLSDIDLTNYLWNPLGKIDNGGYRSSKLKNKIHWVIIGAESGPWRRPCNIEQVRNIKDQCVEAGIPLFVKQIHIKGELACIDKLVKDINKFPEDLRLREVPLCH